MWKEFKEFAFKGNVLDLAVGVIIGSAFGKIVTSIVNDLIMPLLGFFMAQINFKSLKFVLSDAIMDGDTVIKPEVSIAYGNFFQNIIDFLIVSASIFIFIKLINNSKKNFFESKNDVSATNIEKEDIPNLKPSQEEILTEIRDLLKEFKENSK